MKQYLSMLEHILTTGEERGNRTAIPTLGVFGYQARFNLQEGFPLLTTKKIHLKSIIYELLWFLRGDTQVQYLQDNGVRIWNEWATAEQTAKFGRKEGDLGPVYGHQWRNFGATIQADGGYASDGVDQLSEIIETIKKNPNSRRIILTGWNPKEANQVALPPCHTLFQFYVSGKKDDRSKKEDTLQKCGVDEKGVSEKEINEKGDNNARFLSCQLYQRSADVFLGVPFNIASYALLTMMIAQATGLEAKEFVHTFGDLHLYTNHIEQAKLQLTREPKPLPKMHLNPAVKDIFSFRYEDFRLEGYEPHPHIKAEVAI